jgi:hypothetical protein
MRLNTAVRASLLAALATLATTAWAQTPAGAAKRPAADPNQKICEDIIPTGSRLGSKRFCATRAEWEDRRRQDKDAVEKAQLSPCVQTHNGASGRPSC